ncbi:hypothetical protein CIHG_03788 [Coccidioides immitis H538.4]|uniref:Uncharacterized protein n=3 Tax=Coccidioides immitis TaxID=5501 RepID=A0A0J8QY47_COCIT|nr:hypothetical protein CIRG_04969 [Coccidioides immitis RMSCC 2394]KMU77819.1 hypothetical protein CISG_01575 [Coccidioides immitis RMSCC 3703]KMU85748.1 hypothetical protein CIHG_03788 [Coccidioides immitis H538.4]
MELQVSMGRATLDVVLASVTKLLNSPAAYATRQSLWNTLARTNERILIMRIGLFKVGDDLIKCNLIQRCTNCVQGYLDIEPVMEDSKLLTDDESATDTNTYVSQSEAYTANSSRALSVTDDDNLLCGESYDVMSDHTAELSYHALSQLSIKGKGKEENTSLGGGVWLEQGKRFPEEGAAVKPRQGIPFTAYDPQGNAHLRITAPPSQMGSSTADSSQDTWRHSQSVQVRQASHSPAMVVPKRNSNFVKILGGRVPKEQAPKMYLPEPTGRTVGSDGSSSDDDDDDIQDWI